MVLSLSPLVFWLLMRHLWAVLNRFLMMLGFKWSLISVYWVVLLKEIWAKKNMSVVKCWIDGWCSVPLQDGPYPNSRSLCHIDQIPSIWVEFSSKSGLCLTAMKCLKILRKWKQLNFFLHCLEEISSLLSVSCFLYLHALEALELRIIHEEVMMLLRSSKHCHVAMLRHTGAHALTNSIWALATILPHSHAGNFAMPMQQYKLLFSCVVVLLVYCLKQNIQSVGC